VLVVQFPKGKNLSHSKGELTNIDKYEFTHKAGTKSGSSGSPIFLANTTNVIGIHKAGNNSLKENYGDFIFPIINILNKKINNNIQKQNEVTIIIKIGVPFIRLFGEEFVKNNKEKCEIFINEKNGYELKQFYGNEDNEENRYLKEIIKKNNGIMVIIFKKTKIIRNMDTMLNIQICEIISINF